MKQEIVIAGFGGQGILLAGQVLAQAAMFEGREVSWMPSYGPEMRGGTANCITILADSHISSPIVQTFDAGIVLNQLSMDKFSPALKEGGLLIYDNCNVSKPSPRADIELCGIPAAKEADSLKNQRILNMLMVGAFLGRRPVAKIESVVKSLKVILPERYHHSLPLNEKALRRGVELAQLSPAPSAAPA
jgi:2-oxoglutarate ferredoxin oxidoreductase subunit gamma